MTKELNSENIKKAISCKLDILRRNSGQTVEATADNMNIDLSEFYRILRGRRLPQLPTLLRISRKYGVAMDWWFNELADTPQDKVHIRQKSFELQILHTLKKLDTKLQKSILAMLKSLAKSQA
jgi:transcriptional regulator with XRE-family HTH domain